MRNIRPPTHDFKHPRSRFARRATAEAFGKDFHPPEWGDFRDRPPPGGKAPEPTAIENIEEAAEILRRAWAKAA